MIFLGVISILAGLVAIGHPFLAGAGSAIFIGALILVSGICELIGAVKSEGWKQGILASLGGILSIIGGAVILARPVLGLALLTIIVGVFFLVTGVVRILFALKARPLQGWVWILIGGVASLVLGIVIFTRMPEATLWVIGTLIGIHILFNGVAMLTLAGAARSAVKEAQG
jgi:uncharacterized membrane protein HdeD (DUF308 family)